MLGVVLVVVAMGMIVATAAVIAMVVVITSLVMLVVMMLRPVLMTMLVGAMIVVMVMAVRLAVAVGTTLRVESGQHRRHRGAEPLQHVLDDMVVADAQPVAEELGRQVPVAEMPGDANEVGRAGGYDLEQAFRHCLHQDQPAILKLKGVAVLHHGRLLEIEKEHRLADAAHDEAAAVTIVSLEGERIGRRAGPSAGGKDAGGGDHGISALADEESDGRTSLAKSAAEASAAAISTRPSSAATATPA